MSHLPFIFRAVGRLQGEDVSLQPTGLSEELPRDPVHHILAIGLPMYEGKNVTKNVT